MPLCESSTARLRPFGARRVDHLLQVLFLDSEAPVGHEPAWMSDRCVGERLADDGDRHAVDLAHHVRREHGVAEIGGAHVLRDEVDATLEIAADHLVHALGAIGELPVRGHYVHAELQGGVHHVLPARPQRRSRALPGIAAVEQQCAGPLGAQPLHQCREVREAANLAVGHGGLDKVETGEGMRGGRACPDAEMPQECLAHQMRWLAGSRAHTDVHARFPKVHGQQLRVTVGDVQQAHIAEGRQVVQRGCQVPGQSPAAIERESSRGCGGQQLQELAAGHSVKRKGEG